MEINGTIAAVLPLEEITGKTTGNKFMKQTAVLETEGQYPKKVAFEMFGEKRKDLKVGDRVTLKFDVESHEFNGKWFTKVSAWGVEVWRKDGVSSPAGAVSTAPMPT